MPSRLRLGGQQSERRVVIRGRYKSTDSVSSRGFLSSHWCLAMGGSGRRWAYGGRHCDMRRGGVSLDPLSHLAVRVLLCPHCAAGIWCMQRNILISLFISLSALSSKREPCTLHAAYTDSAARCRSSLYTSHPQRDTSHTRGTCESPTSSHYRSRVTTDRHRPANSRLHRLCMPGSLRAPM